MGIVHAFFWLWVLSFGVYGVNRTNCSLVIFFPLLIVLWNLFYLQHFLGAKQSSFRSLQLIFFLLEFIGEWNSALVICCPFLIVLWKQFCLWHFLVQNKVLFAHYNLSFSFGVYGMSGIYCSLVIFFPFLIVLWN